MSEDKTLLISEADNENDVTTSNLAATKLNQTFLNYLTHIFLAFIVFPSFLNLILTRISNIFKKTLCKKYSQRYLIEQDILDNVYGLGLCNISH